MSAKIQESEVHGAFLYLGAQDKRKIEQNMNLSKEQKEIGKKFIEKFYERFENGLIEELTRRCSIRLE